MDDKKYNGWANYATWRVNLEIFDGIDWVDYFGGEISSMDISDIADQLEDMAEEAVSGYGEVKEGIALNYAMAFISDVDWYEIAESIKENYTEENND